MQPFIASQAKSFSAVYLDALLEDSVVKTDEDRVIEFSGDATNRYGPLASTVNELMFRKTYKTGLLPKHWCFCPLCCLDERIVPAEMKTQEWLLPESTANFNELPLQYNGFCGYSLVKRDGLLLPGTVFIKHTWRKQVY